MKLKPTPLLLTFLLAACSNVTVTPFGQATIPPPTLTSLPPTATSVPTITSTPETQQPPACTFPLAGTTMEESTPETYTFSEPRVVIDRYGIDIIEWLPDSKNVLITKPIANSGDNAGKENIELFNPQTGETQIYAVRRSDMWFRPRWVEKLNAIIYPENLHISSSFNNNGMVIPSSIVERRLLWLSRGDPDNVQIIEDVQVNPAIKPHEWVPYSFAIKPDGSQIMYLKSSGDLPARLYSRVVSRDILETEKQSVIQWGYSSERDWFEVLDEMIWRTGTSQIFFYSYGSAIYQTLLLDIDTGQVCALNLDGWVYMARWSPNGRYLAVIKSDSPKISFTANYDLAVLDAITGKLYQIDSTKVGPPEMKNCCRHMVEDFAWAPDSSQLVITGTAGFTGTSTYRPIVRLYLVNFLSGDVDNLFPSYEFYSGGWGTSLAWSPDGTKLLTNCSTEKQGRLCYIPVNINGK